MVDLHRDLRQLKAEAEGEVFPAGVGEMQCAGTFVATEPPELQEAGQQRSSDSSGDVVALFGPVETAAHDIANASVDS
jgi:hypothetical protein